MQVSVTQFYAGGLWTSAFTSAFDTLRRAGGGVLTVPAGDYPTGPIEMFSHCTLELQQGARILFVDDESAYPLEPCQFEGRLELRPKPCLGASGADDIAVIGAGILDGGGASWWQKHRARQLPNGRPYLFHAQDCRGVTLRGITLQNSPAWTVHPLRCEDVRIEDVTIVNPPDSPNTDGIDPESCCGVMITDCTIDVGDDCIAVKAGIEHTAPRRACRDVTVRGCRLLHGHGGVVIGSEMSGGVENILVEACEFRSTDRGLRIKSRRGRGGIVQNITLRDCTMQDVICPFVINLYYGSKIRAEQRPFWEKTPYPKDEGTPAVRGILAQNVQVTNAQACAAFFYGLPESPIENVCFENCTVTMASSPLPAEPAMMYQPPRMAAGGLYARNTVSLQTQGLTIQNHRGPCLDVE